MDKATYTISIAVLIVVAIAMIALIRRSQARRRAERLHFKSLEVLARAHARSFAKHGEEIRYEVLTDIRTLSTEDWNCYFYIAERAPGSGLELWKFLRGIRDQAMKEAGTEADVVR